MKLNMKKIVKVLGIILFSVFLLVPLKTNAQEQVWAHPLDLSDSISSSIVKVEDGVIVMLYEGTASDNNLLIKYDFDGNKIWEVKNDYGYNIESVSDGFIIWNENTITKFDKDKNIKWQQTLTEPLNSLYNAAYEIVEINDGYILYKKNASMLIKLDLNGRFVSTKNTYDLSEKTIIPRAVAPTIDGNGIVILLNDEEYDSSSKVYYEYYTLLTIDSNLNKISETSYEPIELNKLEEKSQVNGMLAIEDGYLLRGMQLTLLTNEGKSKKISDNIVLDIKQVGDFIYTYETPNNEVENYYNTAIIKYDKNLNKQLIIELPLSYHSEWFPNTGMSTGFARIKNRVVYYENDNQVDGIVLNTPVLSIAYGRDNTTNGMVVKGWQDTLGDSFTTTDNSSYGVARYRVSGISKTEENDNNSGIINNIIKNPQTNSIIIIIVLLAIILIVSIVSYAIYKKKTKTKEMK